MGLVKGIHHVSMKCSNTNKYQEVIDFYNKVLGLPIIRQWDTGIMFDTGCGIIEIFNNGVATHEDGAIRHFSLATDDVDACVAAVKAAGYKVFVEPNDLTIASVPPLPIRMAFCKGPLSEEIEFLQEK